jgi:hypothetical protein
VLSSDTYNTGSNSAFQFGWSQGQYDISHNWNSFVTLDFGAQDSSGSGTYLTQSNTWWSNSTIESFAEWFAYGYYKGANNGTSGHTLTLNVGTSNDGSVTDGGQGANWGSVVSTVANHVWSDNIIQGAIDVEAGYGPWAHVNNWEWGDSTGGGYHTSGKLLVDYGDAEGCPQYYTNTNYYCGNGYYTEDYYYLNWGWSPNLSQPEIYYDGCNGYANEPVQWADISWWGNSNGLGTLDFSASLSQNNCLSPDQSYTDLVNATKAAGVAWWPNYETQIVSH